MSEEQFIQHFQAIHAQLIALHGYIMPLPQGNTEQISEILKAIAISLESLQASYEEMQTRLEASEVTLEEVLLQPRDQVVAERQHYHDLFEFAPDAYFLTDAKGLILEANAAARKLLNIRQNSVVCMPLAGFVPLVERQVFRSYLNQLSHVKQVQDWEFSLCPKDGEPFAAQLKVAIARDLSGKITALRIGIRDISQYKQVVTQPLQPLEQQQDALAQDTTSVPSLRHSLDGLQVLIVDDEGDAREFITAVLESHGIHVTAVATTAEALATLEGFRPDVLVSDIRMPDDNGYSLIRKLRELEAEKGWHIPAAALTAYLAEDREKALAAGFESHLHKLAQPTELLEMVARLAGRV